MLFGLVEGEGGLTAATSKEILAALLKGLQDSHWSRWDTFPHSAKLWLYTTLMPIHSRDARPPCPASSSESVACLAGRAMPVG
jgi:hypothetical protein